MEVGLGGKSKAIAQEYTGLAKARYGVSIVARRAT